MPIDELNRVRLQMHAVGAPPLRLELRKVYQVHSTTGSVGKTHPSAADLASEMDAMTQHVISLEKSLSDMRDYTMNSGMGSQLA